MAATLSASLAGWTHLGAAEPSAHRPCVAGAKRGRVGVAFDVALALAVIGSAPVWGPFAIVLAVARFVMKTARPPTNDRPWRAPQHVLPTVTREGSKVHLGELRDLSLEQWRRAAELPLTSDVGSAYRFDRVIDLDAVRDLFLGFTPRHAFVTFTVAGEDGEEYLTLSIERREHFDGAPRPSLWNYTNGSLTLYPSLGSERDVLFRGMSQEEWPYPIVLFPVRAGRAVDGASERRGIRREALVEALALVERLRGAPEHYDYLRNSCATRLLAMGRRVAARAAGRTRRGLWLRGLLSYLRHREEGMQHLAHDLGLIDTSRMLLRDAAAGIDQVRDYCDVGPQLAQLASAGSCDRNEISRRLRDRFAPAVD